MKLTGSSVTPEGMDEKKAQGVWYTACTPCPVLKYVRYIASHLELSLARHVM